MSALYKKVELEEGTPVIYVGVHAVKWNHEWGIPTVGFVEAEGELAELHNSREFWRGNSVKFSVENARIQADLDEAKKVIEFYVGNGLSDKPGRMWLETHGGAK